MLKSNSQTLIGAAIFSLACLFLFVSNSAHAIKKCKDADGNWHYGDMAVQECENSKVTTLNERGFVTDEDPAPKTAEEIQAERELEEEEARKLVEEQAAKEERERILSVYETEKDIDRQRDNQLRSVQSNINVHEAYLKNMRSRVDQFEAKISETSNKTLKDELMADVERSKKSIVEYESELASLKEQKEAVIERYKQEKSTYRELKKIERESKAY